MDEMSTAAAAGAEGPAAMADAAVLEGHPSCWCTQHQTFFTKDQLDSQCDRPSLQLNLCEVDDSVPGHPRLSCSQHHPFFSLDQLAFQLRSPAVQLKGLAEGPRLRGLTRAREHHSVFETDHLSSRLSRPGSQSYGASALVTEVAVAAAVEVVVLAVEVVVAVAVAVAVVMTVVVVPEMLVFVVVTVVGATVVVRVAVVAVALSVVAVAVVVGMTVSLSVVAVAVVLGLTAAERVEVVVAAVVPWHPRDLCLQHHLFFRAGHALFQLACPTVQSNMVSSNWIFQLALPIGLWRDALHSISRFSQHQLCFLAVHDFAAPSSQSNSGDPAATVVVVDGPIVLPVVLGDTLHPCLSF